MNSMATLTGRYSPVQRMSSGRVEDNGHAGLPKPLPSGEKTVWQGKPDFRNFARQVFHTRLIAGYFVIGAIWSASSSLLDGRGMLDAGVAAVVALAAGALVLGIFGLLACIGARATVYSITSERIVMQIGSALTKTINIPFSAIDAVHLNLSSGGIGNISIQLKDDARLAYFFLWPHVRPWRFKQPQPMLRALSDAQAVARVLVNSIEKAETGKIEEGSVHAQPSEMVPDRGAVNMAPAAAPNPMRVPLIASATICAIVLAVVATVQLDKFGTQGLGEKSPEYAHELKIHDLGAGKLAIVDARQDVTLATLGSVGDGLVRGAIRGLQRSRKIGKIPSSASYHLAVWKDGRITLSDMNTNRHFPISSFGATSSSALDALLAIGNRQRS